jgi:hypothetical protein
MWADGSELLNLSLAVKNEGQSLVLVKVLKESSLLRTLGSSVILVYTVACWA